MIDEERDVFDARLSEIEKALSKHQPNWKWWVQGFVGATAVLATVIVIILLFRVSHLQDQLSSQGATSCDVQKRGLIAQPHLLTFLTDLSLLLTPPPDSKVPPGKEKEYRLLRGADGALDVYLSIEKHQPKTRNCSTS